MLRTSAEPAELVKHIIRMTCPHCGAALSGDLEYDGSKSICPECGEFFEVADKHRVLAGKPWAFIGIFVAFHLFAILVFGKQGAGIMAALGWPVYGYAIWLYNRNLLIAIFFSAILSTILMLFAV